MCITIQDIITELTAPIQKLDNTVDVLHYGTSTKVVKKIAISFMPTYEVIQKCVQSNVDLLICHEGIYYNHTGDQKGLKNDVALKKQNLIEESELAIFRFHDYMHRYQPDPVTFGLVSALGWEDSVIKHNSYSIAIELPLMLIEQIMAHIKERLDIPYVRFVGDMAKNCTKVGFLVGYRGGISHSIPLFEEEKVDLIIYGEGPEWETPEYIRDAISQGINRSIIMLGHLESEEAGMRYLAKQLSTQFPDVNVQFMATGSHIKVY